ncbi:hypothetical protein ACFLYA_00875 [Candidatus Dependentiae bacterium]
MFMFIFVSTFFIHFYLFSCQGPQNKKKFVDTEKKVAKALSKDEYESIYDDKYIEEYIKNLIKKEKERHSIKMNLRHLMESDEIFEATLRALEGGVCVDIWVDGMVLNEGTAERLKKLLEKGANVFAKTKQPFRSNNIVEHSKFMVFPKKEEVMGFVGSFSLDPDFKKNKRNGEKR